MRGIAKATLPWLLVLFSQPVLSQEQPVLQVIDFSRLPCKEMAKNGALDEVKSGRFVSVSPYGSGYQVGVGEGINGATAAYCESTDGSRQMGLYWSLNLNQTQTQPITFSGWSRAESVEGSPDANYSLYVDIVHQDGTPTWGLNAPFNIGSHDWEKQTVFIVPDKPVRSISCYALFRSHKGKAWFDDISICLAEPPQGMARLDSIYTQRVQSVTSSSELPILKTPDGLSLQADPKNGSLSSLSIDGSAIPLANAANGFLVRDVGTGSDYYGFVDGKSSTLNCTLELSFHEREHAIHLRGKLTALDSTPRALNLIYAVPIDALGWQWGDHVRKAQTIAEGLEYANWMDIGIGSNGKISRYPFAAIHSAEAGLGIGFDLGKPCQWRLGYSAGADALYLSMDFGLHPETVNFPSQANFEVVLFRINPRWGFRSAAEQFYRIFPPYFEVKSKAQGIWMPFTDVSTVQGWEDFGFRYHEGTNNIPFDDKTDILSFRYSEPSTWWMSMPPEVPRTYAEAMSLVAQHSKSTNANRRRQANALLASGMFDRSGRYQMQFRNEPWTNGAVFSLNSSPYLPGEFTNASLMWNDQLAESLYGPNAKGVQDGEYLDSLEGYVTADLNFRAEHFRAATVPLSFTLDTREPVIHKAFSQYEFTRYMSGQMHSRGKLLFANSVPYRYGFLCPWLDVMGTEANWVSNKQFSPDSDEIMNYRRTLISAKPYLFLMNTPFENMTSAIVERYFQYCLFYGMFPSMFSHNAAEDPYWQNPTLYNRDRPLFKKYQPLIKQVAEAGWQPVTLARTPLDSLRIERFGSVDRGEVFFTVMNTDSPERDLHIQGEDPLPVRAKWKEIISEQEGIWDQGLDFPIQGRSTAVFRLYDFYDDASVIDDPVQDN